MSRWWILSMSRAARLSLKRAQVDQLQIRGEVSGTLGGLRYGTMKRGGHVSFNMVLIDFTLALDECIMQQTCLND